MLGNLALQEMTFVLIILDYFFSACFIQRGILVSVLGALATDRNTGVTPICEQKFRDDGVGVVF